MAPFLSAVAVLLGVAAAGSVHSETQNAQSSITQIRDTLRNLLRSIEDNGRDAESLFGKKQSWCDSNLHDFESDAQTYTTSLQDMQAQLTETEAEVEEAQGTVQQVKVDIEMVQHTIKQTEDMAKERSAEVDHQATTNLLQSLSENKQLSLSSLQGELEVAVPVLAQLQANVAETKQRVSYRTESLESSKDFVSALKDSCQASADRADSQAAARVGESNSIHAALQALDSASLTKTASDDKDDKEDLDVQAAQAMSFIQVEEVSTDDLSDLFAADQAAHPANYAADDSAPVASKQQQAPEIVTAPSLRPRIQTLLTQLKESDSDSSELSQAAWCAKQREQSNMAMKFAQDSVAQISSELEAHTDSEADLGEDLTKLQSAAAAVTASAKTLLTQTGKEQALIQSSRKDQQLATKILDQAMTILKELPGDSTKVVGALASAKKMLLVQIKAAKDQDTSASTKAKAVAQAALTLTKTQESEQHNLEFSRDDHSSQRLRGVENKRLYENDVQEATAYAQKLEESCKANSLDEATQQRSAQMHALEDANKALDGKLVESKTTASALRGVDASHPKKSDANLTPMQRAAMEMGISSD